MSSQKNFVWFVIFWFILQPVSLPIAYYLAQPDDWGITTIIYLFYIPIIFAVVSFVATIIWYKISKNDYPSKLLLIPAAIDLFVLIMIVLFLSIKSRFF